MSIMSNVVFLSCINNVRNSCLRSVIYYIWHDEAAGIFASSSI